MPNLQAMELVQTKYLPNATSVSPMTKDRTNTTQRLTALDGHTEVDAHDANDITIKQRTEDDHPAYGARKLGHERHRSGTVASGKPSVSMHHHTIEPHVARFERAPVDSVSGEMDKVSSKLVQENDSQVSDIEGGTSNAENTTAGRCEAKQSSVHSSITEIGEEQCQRCSGRIHLVFVDEAVGGVSSLHRRWSFCHCTGLCRCGRWIRLVPSGG
ncbi:hypothetical protein BDZ85DRAFT_268814 [Elsinoe ampelina]|uniref:Uncharacterized protein n=1 Tax=Elsinoe ampelina TaxID=302913 RepID=A0A6A6G0Z9_9PEZI|nr:hypothetical protein BDZ85DRAFT_268814 [Elsinoe ampelina]